MIYKSHYIIRRLPPLGGSLLNNKEITFCKTMVILHLLPYNITYGKVTIVNRDPYQRNGVEFIIKPYLRFKGKIGEQSTMLIKDPTGNVLEFKSFKDDTMIFNN